MRSLAGVPGAMARTGGGRGQHLPRRLTRLGSRRYGDFANHVACVGALEGAARKLAVAPASMTVT